MNNSIVTLQYNNDVSVNFTNNAWFNATEVAKSFGKRVNDWLNLESTKEYISKLHAALFPEIPLPENMVVKENQLLTVKNGGNDRGSWFHPKLSVKFARWLDVDFEIWCDMQIEKLLTPKPNVLIEPPTVTKAQYGELYAIVTEIAEGTEEIAKTRAAIWSRFSRHFRINSYKELPSSKYDEALAYLEQKRIEYEEEKGIKKRLGSTDIHFISQGGIAVSVEGFIQILNEVSSMPNVSINREIYKELCAKANTLDEIKGKLQA